MLEIDITNAKPRSLNNHKFTVKGVHHINKNIQIDNWHIYFVETNRSFSLKWWRQKKWVSCKQKTEILNDKQKTNMQMMVHVRKCTERLNCERLFICLWFDIKFVHFYFCFSEKKHLWFHFHTTRHLQIMKSDNNNRKILQMKVNNNKATQREYHSEKIVTIHFALEKYALF